MAKENMEKALWFIMMRNRLYYILFGILPYNGVTIIGKIKKLDQKA